MLGKDPAAGKYVFVKDIHGSGGEGVTVRRTADLKDIQLGRYQIIQEEVTNFVLVEGRRTKIRAYIIVYRGKLYLSRYWAAFKCTSVYTPDNVDEDLQSQQQQQQFIDQLFAPKESKMFDMQQAKEEFWEKNGGLVLLAEDAPLRIEWTAGIAAAATKMSPLFDRIVAATVDNPHRYHIFGIDAIPREDHSIQIIEVNPFPSLGFHGDFDRRLIDGTCFKTRMVASVLWFLFEMEKEMSNDWIELAA